MHDVDFTWPGGAFGLAIDQFHVEQGEKLFLLGASGSGKSTLLSLICGIVTPQRGKVLIAGRDLAAESGASRDRLRAESIGIIFQMFNLLPYASGLDNIILPLRFAPGRRRRCGDARTEALRLSEALGVPAELVSGGPAATLSVGQQQRVAVARAMIGRPPIIVADEPTSALDASAQEDFLNLLFEQVGSAGATLIMVSHDDRLAGRFDRVVPLKDIARVRRAAP
ncbi:putative ABC transport system ATP-binding protein [Aliiruegeria haliotis]|uniref:Putative ABC transport system ATP-binding protein n=1 Tax=Aliiruegeria haliotis TaxID=1280846 RepID=A0A2T0RRE2_9RHOB|nr:ABC transporter ATP-binding protein [Aliiruegeria haliotis]PRY23721.1 putative ABC transport system ATP-binding protein [Aliiruegeria haliotis]